MGAGGTWAVSWEGKGAGGKGSDQLGVGHCWGHSTESVLCSKLCVYCLDLVDEGTGGTQLFLLDGVHENATLSVKCLGRRV